MSQHMILTAIGNDRPGLVDEVSQFIFERGGNIDESRMVNLRGQFAVMLLLSGSDAVTARLREDMPRLMEATGLHGELRPAEVGERRGPATARTFKLTASAMDQPGLVHRIAHLLREMNVNIESLNTQLAAAPVSGAPVFEMELMLSLPEKLSLSELRTRLARLCDEHNIDWDMKSL
jgi:glycine cleavage system transcriptional repressor